MKRQHIHNNQYNSPGAPLIVSCHIRPLDWVQFNSRFKTGFWN